jgi:glucose/arabinose dehydrogenase
MRIALPILVVLLAGLGVGYAAFGRGDPLDDLKIPEVATESGTAHHFDVKPFAKGFNRPTWVGQAPGDDAIWVTEQPGRVLRLDGGRRTVALDLSGSVRLGAEQGLLGIAFHPDFATDRRVYLHWSDPKGDTRVAEFRARRDGTIDPKPLRELLYVDQPEENHNGGQLLFGPDGRLYLGLGDGGGAFDPRRTAQDPDEKLGKILAADVREPTPRWDVVLSGLRNPWRFSFDAALGELWIGDVGQDDVEEINRVLPEPDEPPKNLGWSAFEGTERVKGHDLDDAGELVWPVAQYPHPEGCSVTGGVVYAGSALSALGRRYVYGDFCAGALWTLEGTPEGRATDVRREQAKVPGLTHIGTTNDGELLFASGNGALYRALPAEAGAGSGS